MDQYNTKDRGKGENLTESAQCTPQAVRFFTQESGKTGFLKLGSILRTLNKYFFVALSQIIQKKVRMGGNSSSNHDKYTIIPKHVWLISLGSTTKTSGKLLFWESIVAEKPVTQSFMAL